MPPALDPRPAALDRAAVRAELESARLDFHQLIGDATPADLRRQMGPGGPTSNYCSTCCSAT